MKNLIFIFLSLFTLFLIISFKSITDQYQIIYPENWPEPTVNLDEYPISQEGVELGRKLFYDPILSKDNTISCATCHSPYMAFAHVDHKLSHGIGDSIGRRNALPLFNLAWNKSFMWDGGINHIEIQPLTPITDEREMGEDLRNVAIKLQADTQYVARFQESFNADEITGELILKALAQFQLTLISSNSKFDRVSQGLDSFTIREQRGYELFKNNCNSCHTEPLFTNQGFANNGLLEDPYLLDYGKFMITRNPIDSFMFRVPTLRNIEYTPPYMHDGRFRSLNSVLNHYSNVHRINNGNFDTILQERISLSHQQKIELIDFLKTLSDPSFLRNKTFHDPRSI